MANHNIFQEISDRIAAQLEQGVRPWAKPWKDTGNFSYDLPHNIERRAYRGANAFWLMLIGQAKGYESPMWLTFNQAKERGGNVIRGEVGTTVFFWKFGTSKDKVTGEEKSSVLVRQYTVFNIAQTEGVAMPAQKANLPTTEAERNEAAEAMITKTGAVIKFGGDRACYIPSRDYIQMPERAAFKDSDGYYGTAFHELGHWTGHESRLNRTFGASFGDENYAAEELVAELTAAFICGANGFASIEREDHAAYIKGWAAKIKSDPRAFITAAGKAQKAADLIMGNVREEEDATPAQAEAA